MHIGQDLENAALDGSAQVRRMFVDMLCLSSLPWMLLFWVVGWMRDGVKPLRLYYFAISPRARTALRWLARLLPVSAQEAEYSALDLTSADGSWAWLQARREDLREVCDEIRQLELKDHPLVQRMGRRFGLPRVLIYLEKCIERELSPVVIHIRVVEWYRRVWQLDPDTEVAFFIARTPWHPHLAAYAIRHGVRLLGYWPLGGWRPRTAWRWLRSFLTQAARKHRPAPALGGTDMQPVDADVQMPARIAVSFIGKCLTLDPTKNSELFWLPYVKAKPGQVLLYFWRADVPLDEAKREWLEQAGIHYVAMNHQAVACEGAEVWQSKLDPETQALRNQLVQQLCGRIPRLVGRNSPHLGWLQPRLLRLIDQYAHWHPFFKAFNIKILLTHLDWTADHVAAGIALSDLGGISVAYQLSVEAFVSVFRASAVDIHFAFAPHGAQTECRSGSHIAQYVSVGYNYDNAFAAVRGRAGRLRAQLQSHGARFIICFFDENSSDDKRLGPTHEHAAENYTYLLRKLMDDPTLGLIFKPKKQNTLHARLGPVAQLLDAALATGRCFIFSEGEILTDALPNEASQAADVAIGLLLGTTAAAESALAGTPTLLIDRAHMLQHPYYRWGRDRVVFDNWDKLFAALTAYRHDPSSDPGFGDWSPVLDQLDPFRDGRAAERMGTYIRWLAEGLDMGLSVDETLKQARQRYVALWGADKVIDLLRSS